MGAAQVSLESLLVVSILLVFFIASLGLLAEINLSAQTLKTQAAEWNECMRIAGLVEEVFVQGPGTQVTVPSSMNLAVSSRTIYSTTMACDFTAVVQPVSLLTGTIRISNSNGVVVLENA